MKSVLKKFSKAIGLTLLASLCFFSCSNEQKKRDTIRMNISSEPDSFFPWKAASADTKAILYNIFEGLTSFDETGKIIPCLAESYSISDDGLLYKFNLRKNVRFHNDKQFTSEDVIYTYKNLAGLDGLTARSDEMQIIKRISATSDYSVEVELKSPSASFLTFANAPILQADYDDNEANPIGTGPYKFVQYVIHQKVVLTANENYWDKENFPSIKNVELYVISDEASCLSSLASKQIDIAQMITATNANALKDKYEVISYPQNMVQIFAMNNALKPFDDMRVRRAVCLAVNKHEIIEGAFDGMATELYSNFSPVLKNFYNSELTSVNRYDVEQAKALLKEAGYENGFEITITVPSNYTPHVDSAVIIKSQLEKIGITAKIQSIEWASWLSDVYSNKKYETTVIAFGGKLEPNDILKRYVSTYKKNFVNFNNKEYDSIFTKALTETNEALRISQYKKCQSILSDECPCCFICDPNNVVLLQDYVKGFSYYPVVRYNFSKMYFED